MESVDPSEFLSAADCASRTGLTARALRVYEEFGLIAPRRSAGGWRQYGPHDLMKLYFPAYRCHDCGAADGQTERANSKPETTSR